MSTDEILKEQLELAERITEGNADDDDAERLAELVLNMNESIKDGAKLPEEWTDARNEIDPVV